MLLSKPDLLILDEPTNHLDIETLGWLEKYLVSYEGAILIVSHDRYFLDQIVTITYEVSRRKVTKYVGNYSAYLVEKAKNYERDKKLYERETSEKAKLEDFIQRNIARASTSKMAKSRRKLLERTEWMDAPDGDEKSASFSFSIERPSGNDVLTLENIAVGYNGKPVSEQYPYACIQRRPDCNHRTERNRQVDIAEDDREKTRADCGDDPLRDECPIRIL